MEFFLSFYFTLIFFSAVVSFTIAFISWRRRHGRLVNGVFALLMIFVGFWSLMNFLELSLPSYEAKLIASNFVYLGIVGTVAFWFIFALVYTGRDYLLTRWMRLFLCIEPFLLLIFLWTDPWFPLIHQSVWLDVSGPFPVLMADYAFGFWIHAAYSYLLLFIGSFLLIRNVVYAPGIYKRQAVLLVISMVIPWFLNALYILGFTRLDLTAAGFAVTGVVVAWGLLRLRLLDIVPTARTAVFASLHDAVLTLDAQNRIVDLNPAAESLIGKPEKEVIGRRIEDVFAHRPALIATYGDVPEAQAELSFEDIDPPRYYDMRISSIYDQRPHPMARVVVIRDISAQKIAEKAEREERLLAEALRDVAVALNSTLDPQEVFSRILINVAKVLPHDAANISLYESGLAYMIGSRGYTDDHKQLISHRRHLLVAETPTVLEMIKTRQPVVISAVQQDPRWRDYPELSWIGSYVAAPILQDDEVIGFLNLDSKTPHAFQAEHAQRLMAFADQAAIALKNARLFAELAERNQELDAYSRTIAHDLNTPLALIKGYGELLAGEELSETGRSYLHKIVATTERMAEMIEQLLFLAKLRDVEEAAVSVEILPVLLTVQARFEAEIEARGVNICWSEDLPPVRGHALWLEEIFANLVGNAIKYIGRENPAPTITIRGSRQGEMVHYEVEDNGLGIVENQLSGLFTMFTRYHQEEASGTGLGLPIVQRIVTKLGGQLGVSSAENQGSTFWFTLPAG